MKIYSDDYLIKIQNKIHASNSYRILAILAFALVYFVAARLALYTALTPGFATPIWPASGIALAVLLLFGYSLWPSILLGSFLHNILIFPTLGDWHSWIAAGITGIIVGSGAVVEAILSTYLIKRFIHSPFPFNKVRYVILFFGIAIGVCLLAAFIGVSALTVAGAIPLNQYVVSWWTWWIGDCAGILVFTPLILSWVYNSKTKWSLPSFLEILGIIGFSAIFLYASLVHKFPLNFGFIPLAIWVSFRFNFRGATLYIAAITVILAFFRAWSSQSTPELSLNSSYLLLEIFIGVLTLITLVLSAALKERSEAEELLGIYNRSLEHTIEQRTLDLQKRLGQMQEMQKVISDQEKLAYLGELATGIAHDIKDPLNIINSLSAKCKEISNSLAEGLRSPQNTNQPQALLHQMDSNLKAISENGKKAIEFAQGLIYHSKDKPGYFQMVDINNLCSEYLKLASHEMYSTDPWYDVQIKKDFDPSIGLISAIPQDISVVLFNLLSNANYSVHEKKKHSEASYQPKVLIRTQNLGNKIAIIIRDNGMGIHEGDKDKLFIPFFSTKPLGQGLGLGLSSAQEIIVDKHEGEILVDSKEGDYTEFKIILPRHRQIKLNEEF